MIFGGQAGGGKSYGLLMEPLRHVGVPGFGAVMFRREYPEIRATGALWEQSEAIYYPAGGRPRSGLMDWSWPSGATVSFHHMAHSSDRLSWSGAQICLLGWDQLEQFEEEQFWFLVSRNRSTCGVRPYIRATCNPVPDDDPVGGWLHRLVQWWIDPGSGFPIDGRSGKLRWFIRESDRLVWADTPAELQARFPDSLPKSLTFIRSRLEDNPALTESDPGYEANLRALPWVEQQRLLYGNWNVKPAAGLVLNRAWFEIVDAAPAGGSEVRAWDKAATPGAGDRTAGVKMKRVGDLYYVTDCVTVQLGGPERETLIRQIAELDGPGVTIWLEQEPGSGGKDSALASIRALAGWRVYAERPTGPKVARWGPLGAQALAGNVKLVRAPWNEEFLRELHHADGSGKTHDDIPDAAALAFSKLVSGKAHLQLGISRGHKPTTQEIVDNLLRSQRR